MLCLFEECPFRICLIAVIVYQLSGPSIAHGQSTQTVTIDTVVNAWRERKAHVRTVDFHAVGTMTRAATRLGAEEGAVRSSSTATGGEAVSISEKATITKMRFVADEKGAYEQSRTMLTGTLSRFLTEICTRSTIRSVSWTIRVPASRRRNRIDCPGSRPSFRC